MHELRRSRNPEQSEGSARVPSPEPRAASAPHQCAIPYSGFAPGEEWVCNGCGTVWQFHINDSDSPDGRCWEAIGQLEEVSQGEFTTESQNHGENR
jgi:hypothetical protein